MISIPTWFYCLLIAAVALNAVRNLTELYDKHKVKKKN
jgi:hypothetical protein